MTTLLPNPTRVPNATAVADIAAASPTAIASDGADVLYVAETPTADSSILRYTVSSKVVDAYAETSVDPATGASTTFKFASGLSVDKAAGRLYVADDPSDGAQVLQGHVYTVDTAQEPLVAGAPRGGAAPPPPVPAAKTASLVTGNLTAPAEAVTMGTHTWIADHVMGFCRVDGNVVNQATCVTSPITSPGQRAFDAARNLVYVPDNSAKSLGVYRLKFDPVSEIVSSPTLLAPGQLGGIITTAVALDSNGRVLVGAKRTSNIKRILTPAGASQTVQTVGNSSDGRGISALATIGDRLYIAEGGAVTTLLPNATSPPKATAVAGITVTAPTAIAADAAAGTLYFADTPADMNSTVYRFSTASGAQGAYASTGTLADGSTVALQGVGGLSVDSAGKLLVSDDPAAGAQTLQGHLWEVAAG